MHAVVIARGGGDFVRGLQEGDPVAWTVGLVMVAFAVGSMLWGDRGLARRD